MYKGQRIISDKYIDEALKTHVVTDEHMGDFNYGYHIWVGRNTNTFLFNGMLGQNVLCFRDTGIMLVTNGGDNFNFQQCDFFDIVQRAFGGKFEDSLPEDRKAKRSLDQYIKSLKWDTPKKLPQEKLALFAGKRFVADDRDAPGCGLMPTLMQTLENNYTSGIKAIEIAPRTDAIDVSYIENDDTNRFTVGIGKPNICNLKFKEQNYLAAVTGDIKENEDDETVLKIIIDFLEMPSTRTIKLTLKKRGAVLRQYENPGRQYLVETVKNLTENQGIASIISSAVENFDRGYIEYKVDKSFSPEIKMTKE